MSHARHFLRWNRAVFYSVQETDTRKNWYQIDRHTHQTLVPDDWYQCLVCVSPALALTLAVIALVIVSTRCDCVYHRYRCDACDGYIAGTRIHCLECPNFDLCLGCFNASRTPLRSDLFLSVLIG